MSKPIILCLDIDTEPAMFNLYLLQVENQGGRVGEHYDACFTAFRGAMRAVKNAETAIYLKEEAACRASIDEAIGLMRGSAAAAKDLIGTLDTLRNLFDHPPTRDDFLFRRERTFSTVDYRSLYRRVSHKRAIWSAELWESIVSAFKHGGCRGALQVLRSHADTIARGLNRESKELRRARGRRGFGVLAVFRSDIAATAALHLRFAELMAACICFTLIVQEASHALLARDRAMKTNRRRRHR